MIFRRSLSVFASLLHVSLTAGFPTAAQWAALNTTVGGRLAHGIPLAESCYSNYHGTPTTPNPSACSVVQAGYDSAPYISSQYGGFQNTNWGTCQKKAQGCPLNYSTPTAAVPPGQQCYQGVISPYYIEVTSVSDVQAGLAFAKQTGVDISIKNTGHDYKGRSSSPNSLSLWTHNVQPALKLEKNFIPDGCSEPIGDGVTMGAGQQFAGLYAFADQNDVTVIGGAGPTVGMAGGWIGGGGHSAISNIFGLGVDNVMQIRGVLPNGTYITANACQNPDLWFAWRGGGGGTFGINMEITVRAHPKVTLQVMTGGFYSVTPPQLHGLIAVIIQNGAKWASQGWGGYIAGSGNSKLTGLVLANPRLSYAQAVISMAPLTAYIAAQGLTTTANVISTVDGFYNFFENYLLPGQELVGLGTAIGGRLIPSALFSGSANQAALYNAMVEVADLTIARVGDTDPAVAQYGSPFQLNLVTPNNFATTAANDTSAINPAWRSSIWSAIANVPFSNSAAAPEIQNAFAVAHNATEIWTKLAPNSGCYLNEADVYESNPVATFWGQKNYDRLLAIKKQIDPDNILTCWDCIGWNPSDERYSCYPGI